MKIYAASLHKIFILICCSIIATTVSAQNKLGDNLGKHIAQKDLDLKGHSISAVQLVNAKNLIIGTTGSVVNESVAMQVNGSNKTILIPRVTNLLSGTTPSIPAVNAVEGMIVYDLATHKFYVRNHTNWISFDSGKLANGQIYIGDISGNLSQVTLNGDVTINNTGLSSIGNSRVVTNSLAEKAVTALKIAPGAAGQYLQTNAAGTGIGWITSDYLDLVNRQTNIKGLKTFVSDSGLVAEGNSSSFMPVVTPGSRMIWYPSRSSFRAGSFAANQLLNTSIGYYSTAFGVGSSATNQYTFAAGKGLANGGRSTALGNSNANLIGSFASGYSSATNNYATSFGNGQASGQYAVAGGYGHATGQYAIAIGWVYTRASGDNSVAFGYSANTNGMSGSFLFGPTINSTAVMSTAPNQWMALFDAGYKFYSNSTATIGVSLSAGGSSWATLSDKRRKENFISVDAQNILAKIDTMFLGSWNYKGQTPGQFRHYGPMAQDFYAAFGKDTYGSIGNDTTIAAADIDGITLIAIKGLIKSSDSLQIQLSKAHDNNIALEKILDEQRLVHANLIAQFKARIQQSQSEANRKLLKAVARNRRGVRKIISIAASSGSLELTP
jgi:hypothetical protein